MLFAASGCFGPGLPEGFSCADNGLCPSGQFCDPVDDRCRFVGLEGDGGNPGDDRAPALDGPSADRCDDPDIIVCLKLDGDVEDGSSQRTETEGQALGFADGVIAQAGDFSANSEILVVDYIDVTPGPETIELWLLAAGDGRLLETPLFTMDVAEGALNMAIEGSTIGVGIPTGDFVHIAIAIGDRTEFFVDGRREFSIGFSLGTAPEPELVVGSELGSFVGRVDELRVWKRMLTSEEVAEIAAIN